jgi:16S rRNA (guanine(966)-N(2))-methyltransferase RsmD
MRVIAGQFRSRHLHSLPGLDLRPTADRLRETLFNVLTAGAPEALASTCWLDLFAGTGAVGIEALSRGAGSVIFVDASARAAQLIARNLAELKVAAGVEIMALPALRALHLLDARGATAHCVFLDPPYAMHQAYNETLGALAESKLVTRETLVIAEHDRKFDPGDGFGNLARYRKLIQGDAGLSFYRL